MNEDQLYKVRHSLSHVMAMAVLDTFPEAKLAIGPPIDTGFYYDVDIARGIQPEDLNVIEKKMQELLKQPITFIREIHTIAEARDVFAKQPYKLELIEDLAQKGETEVSFYTSGTFTDLCKGPHVESIKEIPRGSFKLSHAAGAYWKGSEKNPMLQRIYGLAFETKEVLDSHIQMLEEAKKRDHRKLGVELDLFTFSDLVGSGLPLWTPKGTILRELLDEFVWKLRKVHGYQKVEIPHITKKDLYETSGHWEKFQEELFKITTREGHLFVMKPMNCPHHTQIFARQKWSYREMPQRYSNTTMCYRDEQSGELSGLSRVRSFTQDDAHVFCRYNQAKDELLKVWGIVEDFYSAFGFDLKIRLSFHDPENMSAYLGDEKVWLKAESDLQKLVEEKGSEYYIGIGEAAFYGPKIDFMAHDSLGRQWQVATIQLDMNMPVRFNLTYTNEEGHDEHVLMLHVAIMGSLERFLSVLIEHYAGNFPFWLSPVQVAVLSVSDQCNDAAIEVTKLLNEAGIRAEVDTTSESVGKKIRNASVKKVPAKIVIGKDEVAAKEESGSWSVKINWRSDFESQEDGQLKPISSVLGRMVEMVKNKK